MAYRVGYFGQPNTYKLVRPIWEGLVVRARNGIPAPGSNQRFTGVGGGLDIPFQRDDDICSHDEGGTQWIDTTGTPSRRIAINPRAVTWRVLNETEDLFSREHGYAFVDPRADMRPEL